VAPSTEPTTTEPEPLLDISGLAPTRPTIRLRLPSDPEGTLYEIKLLAEFGIAEQQALVQDGQKFDKLFGSDKLNNAERKQLKTILDRMFETVLVAPAKVKAECNDSVRSQIVTAFTVAPLVMAQTAEQEATEGQSTTET